MTDPYVDQILRDAQEDGNGGAIAFIILLAFLVVCGFAIWVAHGGRLN